MPLTGEIMALPAGDETRHDPQRRVIEPPPDADAATILTYLMDRSLVAIGERKRVIVDYVLPNPKARQGLPVMGEVENLEAIQMARQLLETRAKLNADEAMREDVLAELESVMEKYRDMLPPPDDDGTKEQPD